MTHKRCDLILFFNSSVSLSAASFSLLPIPFLLFYCKRKKDPRLKNIYICLFIYFLPKFWITSFTWFHLYNWGQRLYLYRSQRNKRRGGSISGGTSKCHFTHSPAKPERSFAAFSETAEEHHVWFFFTASPYALHLVISQVLIILKDSLKPGASFISRYL